MANSNHHSQVHRPWKPHAALLMALLAAGTLLIRNVPPSANLVGQAKRATASNQQIVEAFGRLPLQFEANRGQAPGDARFVARGRGFSASFTPRGILLQLDGPARPVSALHPCLSLRCESIANATQTEVSPTTSAPLIRIGWEGRGDSQTLRGAGPSAARVHYLTGNDATAWTHDVPLYDQVVYPQVRPGMDLVFYGRQQEMEFEIGRAHV